MTASWSLRPATQLGHVGYWAAALTILVLGWGLYDATRDNRTASTRVDRTLQVMENIAGVRAGLGRAEAAQRGFLLYGEARFRQEREAALQAARTDVADLARLTAEDAERQLHAAALQRMLDERARIMHEHSNRHERGEEFGRGSGRGQQLSGQIHAVLDAMGDAERRALENRRLEQERTYGRTVALLIGAVAALFVVMVPAYAGFVREARKRHRAERMVRSLADSAPGALVQYRVFPDGRSKYEFLSENVVRLRGIDPRAALRDPEVVLGTIHDEDRQPFIAALAEGARTLMPVTHDYRVRGPDGEIRWMRTSAMPRRASDGSTVWSAYWSDVTEQKMQEARLRESRDAADAANRAKSAFLAIMSHEIRTPMNGVLGLIELLAMTDLSPEQRSTLELVRESGRSLQRIIDDILDLSKIEAGKLELRPEPTCVPSLVARVGDTYAGNASSKGLLLGRHVDPGIRPLLLVDPLRLRQVLSNLVSNAIKFTAAGEVELRAELRARLDDADRIAFVVRDTGIGIDVQEQEGLFKPYSQGVAARQAEGGTGLGLSICHRLSQLMGGELFLESAPGKGTTVVFEVTLPLAHASAQQATTPPKQAVVAPPVRRAAPTIAQAEVEGTLLLVVDDHPVNRHVLCRQVAALGYAAESAAHGREAVELMRHRRYGGILTDCNMPEMDGYALTAHIRAAEAREARPRTAIVACTANALGGEAEKCLAAGMDAYVVKPVDLARLAEVLDRLVPLPAGRPLSSGPPPFADDATPLDEATLRAAADGDDAMAREILTRFREYNSDDVLRLARAAHRWDLPELRHAAHRIKGAARTIGARPLAHACEALEHACRDGDLAAARAAMPALYEALERLDEYLDRQESLLA